MFGLPPPPAAAPSTPADADALEAAEAALAAEFASAMEPGGVAADAPDSRTDLRVQVSWPARMRTPDGRVVDLQVRDLCEGGVGLTSDEPIPAHPVVDFEMDVPPLDARGEATPVKGTIKPTYAIAHGSRILCGGTWVQAPPAELELVTRWIERLRR